MNFKIFKHKLVDFLSEDPNFCAINGLSKLLGDLPDPGKNKRISNQGKLKMLLNLLKLVDFKSLNENEREEYVYARDIIHQSENYLNIEIENIPQVMKKPQAVEVIFDPIYFFYYFDNRDSKFRLVNIISRLNKVPEFINSYVRNLKKPVKIWVDVEIQKIETIKTFLSELETWAINEEFKNIKALSSSIIKAKASFARYKDLLLASKFSINTVIGTEQALSILNSIDSKLSIDSFNDFNKELYAISVAKIESIKSKIISKYNLDNDLSLKEIETFLRDRKLKSKEVSSIRDIYKSLSVFCLDKELVPKQCKLFHNLSLSNKCFIKQLRHLDNGLVKQPYLNCSSMEIETFGELFDLTQVVIYDSLNVYFLNKSSSNFLYHRRSFNDHNQNYYLSQLLQDLILDNKYFEDYYEDSLFLAARSIYNKILFSAIELCFMTGDISCFNFINDIINDVNDLRKSAKKVLNQRTVMDMKLIEDQLSLCSQNRGQYVLFVQNYYRFLNSNEDTKNKLFCHFD